MATVGDLLKDKGNVLHTIEPRATVYAAIEKMVQYNIGSLLVCDEAGAPVGILTERDYLRRVALEGRASRTTLVEDIMTPDPIFVDPSTTIDKCMQLISQHRIRHLPVKGQGAKPVGMLSVGDIVQNLVRDRDSQIKELTSYIQGQYG